MPIKTKTGELPDSFAENDHKPDAAKAAKAYSQEFHDQLDELIAQRKREREEDEKTTR